jgi:hypothetical protein
MAAVVGVRQPMPPHCHSGGAHGNAHVGGCQRCNLPGHGFIQVLLERFNLKRKPFFQSAIKVEMDVLPHDELTKYNNCYNLNVTSIMNHTMAPEKHYRWLILMHQLPPQSNALRVKIWRRLQRVGAVAIKQSVYVMPFSAQSREDLSWTLKEIREGGGDGSVSEVRFVEGLTDDQIVSLFRDARKADYEKIIQDANGLLAEWSSGNVDPHDPAVKAAAQVNRLQRRLDEVTRIDFFEASQRGTAEMLIKDLTARLSGGASEPERSENPIEELKGKTWVTRKNLFVDRIACGWLIRRFVDEDAVFNYVDADTYMPKKGELRFDMFEAEYTHEGDRCTFEVMIRRLSLQDEGLAPLAQVIHDIDLKDNKYGRAETEGLQALLTGLAACQPDDDTRMNLGMQLIENLYAYYSRQKGR